ncbi:MAG: GGDEF domain-containing protein [Candidatus Hydrogenedentes bacterium]|nr:GGDEF domain-containing protein [Candidatus Hydrogenedentota bacterium]
MRYYLYRITRHNAGFSGLRRHGCRRVGGTLNTPRDAFQPTDRVFETLMDHLQEGVYFVDRFRTIQYWNRGAEELTGYTRLDVTGRCCASNILSHVSGEGEKMCTGSCPLLRSMADGQPRQTAAYLLHKDGHRLPVMIRTSPIRDDSGTIVGALESFTDNTQQISAIERIAALEQQALICPLTLVGNRRCSEMVLEEKFAELKRYRRTFGVAFIDLDHFKEINDRYGHTVGDVCLKIVAGTIRNDLRSFDFVGRWGGEEFIVVVDTADTHVLEGMAKRLCTLVSHSSERASGHKIELTISVGATLATLGDSPATLVERADEAMYESKRGGRNRVTMT